MKIALPPEVTHHVNVLNERAHSLRAQADGLPELLAKTYRRRAAELADVVTETSRERVGSPASPSR